MEKWLQNWLVSQEYHFCYMLKGCEVFSNKKYTIVVHDKRGLVLMYPCGYYGSKERDFILKDLETQA